MPRMSMPPPRPARRPPSPPPKAGTPRRATLGEPRDMKDRPHGWKLALRRHRRRLRPVLYGSAALGLLVAIVALAHANSHAASLLTLRTRFGALGAALGLRVETITVQGRDTTPEPLLDAAIGAAPGDPLLGYSVADARARVASLPSVQDATVERRWPSTLLVALTERHPFAVWQNQGRFTLIDRDGATLADQDPRLAPELPLVVGLGAPAHAATLLDLLGAHPAIRAHMVAAVRVSDRRWNLRMTSGADVMLPQDDEQTALARLDQLQATHHLLDRRLEMIDLRLPDRVTLRPDAAAMPQPDVSAPPTPPLTTPPPAPVTRSPKQPT